jgi:hypothetical protein
MKGRQVKIKKQIINKHGEVVRESLDVYSDVMTHEGYRFPAHKLGARMFSDVRLPEKMSYADKGRMQDLARCHMIPGCNMLGYRESHNIKPYTAREIGYLIGLYSRCRCREFLNKMLGLRVLHRVQDTSGVWQYYVNPAYYTANGKRLSLSLFLLFRDELAPLLPEWVMSSFLMQARAKDARADTWEVVEEAERIMKGVGRLDAKTG